MCGLAKWTQAVGSTQDSDLLVLNTLDSLLHLHPDSICYHKVFGPGRLKTVLTFVKFSFARLLCRTAAVPMCENSSSLILFHNHVSKSGS